MNPTTAASGQLHRRAPRWGPNRTPRAASCRSLRSGPWRLYPHRGARLADPIGTINKAFGSVETRLKTINR